MALPNLIIVGAPKAGTTSLFKWLQAHPSVRSSRAKETYYLMDRGYPFYQENANYQSGGLDGYARLFPEYENGQVCIEATPDYMFQQTALKVLTDLPTKPVIVFIFRDPVERILSLYRFAQYRIGSLEMRVTAREFYERAKSGQFLNDQILNSALLHSEYHRWLAPWLSEVGNARIEVLFFEELVQTPYRSMEGLCLRLGIDPLFYRTYSFTPENQSRPIRSTSLLYLRNNLDKFIPHFMLTNLAKLLYRKINVISDKPETAEDSLLIRDMHEYFADPNKKLASMLGRKLPASWGKS